MTQDYLACAFANGACGTLPPLLAETLLSNGLNLRDAAAGLMLFAAEGLPVRSLAGRAGWAIGPMFRRDGSPAPAELDVGAAASPADMMISRFWGSYVVLERGGDGVQALRDPSGGLSCYHAEAGGVHYFTSVPHLLIDCGLIPPQLDWDVIALSLVQHSARASRTAIRGIDELLPGTQLIATDGGMQRAPVWHPWTHAANRPPADPTQALSDALFSTLEAWGRSFDHPLIEISGGLDSAIVAAGLSRAAPRASLITFAAAAGDPDETPYAQAIADALGLPLEIAAPCVEDVDLTRSLSADQPRPNARAFTQAADAQSLRQAQAIGADLFVSGGGGDDVFCYLRTVLPALDRLKAEGLQAMIASASDIAVMTHATVWEALSRIVGRLARRGPSRSRQDLRFLAGHLAALAEGEPTDQPPIDRRFPGKAQHVRAVLTIHNYLEGHARSAFAPILSPLLSQPIVECCLSIPTWLWCEGGRNRAVARRAFAGRLPQIVLERRSKGRFDGFCAALLETNRELVRSMLLEGCLAGRGLLDRQAICGALDQSFPSAETVARLLVLTDVESWTQSWMSRPLQRF
jgi:asparagine synthase (glutamine-hydrolysing)